MTATYGSVTEWAFACVAELARVERTLYISLYHVVVNKTVVNGNQICIITSIRCPPQAQSKFFYYYLLSLSTVNPLTVVREGC